MRGLTACVHIMWSVEINFALCASCARAAERRKKEGEGPGITLTSPPRPFTPPALHRIASQAQGDKKTKAKAKKGKAAGDDAGIQGEIDGTYRSQMEEWVPVACMECRGLKPIKVHIGHDFDVTSSAGTVFEEADFGLDGQGYEWAEYDEKNDLSVTVSNLQARIVVVS